MPGKADGVQCSPALSAQLTGLAILVYSNNSLVIACVNHQGASGQTRGQQGTTLLAIYIPRGEDVAADASLRVGLSQQNGLSPLDSPVALSVNLEAPMFACHIAVVWGQEHLLTHVLNSWKR